MSDIVKTNIYRCIEYCPNCPFLDNGKKINLNDSRVDEIKEMLLNERDSSFNCHKTVYNLDNKMEKSEPQALKMCYGAYKYLLKHNKPNQQMRLAERLGIDK